jgi:hypothetical protein
VNYRSIIPLKILVINTGGDTMERSRPYFDHPARAARKSVVREAAAGHGTRTRAVGTGNTSAPAGAGGGVAEFLKTYRPWIFLGAGALVVAIVYQIYSRRINIKKDETQIERGLNAIESLGGHASGARAPLQVDPAVIEVLQQQVLDYQAQVDQLGNTVF